MNHASFVAYAIACLVLSVNLGLLWAYSGIVRSKTKTAVNHEDAAQFKVALVDTDPPAVARVLRAHANAQAAIYPFLFLGLVFILAGGAPLAAEITFGIFTLARITHSFIYLNAKQPWRTMCFVVAGLTTLALLIQIIVLLLQHSCGCPNP